MTTKRLSAIALALLAGTSVFAQELTDPIKLTLHDWTGQLITTQLMGEVLKAAGYNVEYVQADYLAQFAGLETGDLTSPWRSGRPPGARRWTPRSRPATS